MSENIKSKTGEETDVSRQKVIDFEPLRTKERDDDQVWNSMEFMGESDEKEAEYESPLEVSQQAKENISKARAKFIGVRMLKVLNMKVA